MLFWIWRVGIVNEALPDGYNFEDLVMLSANNYNKFEDISTRPLCQEYKYGGCQKCQGPLDFYFYCKISFGTAYTAIWLNGPRTHLNHDKKQAGRSPNKKVIIKKLINSQTSVIGIIRMFGISQDPVTDEYAMRAWFSDIHPGNIFAYYERNLGEYHLSIGDVGLCIPADKSVPLSNVYGVLPYT
ncbi:hypothetical protein C1645_819632 [Glomus cerebriforme]|uniref:Uncharacterized protein n=1 Tax=Glomus cerebriforme TaxID=658196 RepID=A0A397T5T4_9GLOM|nr:hypothetical protein C1645_819632 [Glomus cerebriforme]